MELPKTTIKPRDFGVGGLKALTNVMGMWDTPTCGVSISYSIFFDGRYFIDPHSNLTLGRLYASKCPLVSGAKPVEERYGIMWYDKDEHPKADMTVEYENERYGSTSHYGERSHSGAYNNLKNVVYGCVKDISLAWDGVDDHIETYDALHFSKERVNEDGNRIDVTDMRNPDIKHYFESCHAHSYPTDYCWDKVRKSVKFTLRTLAQTLAFVRRTELDCRLFQHTLPKECRVPDDIVGKVTQKILAADSLTRQAGRSDVQQNADRIRNLMKALNIITDKELLVQDTEVMY